MHGSLIIHLTAMSHISTACVSFPQHATINEVHLVQHGRTSNTIMSDKLLPNGCSKNENCTQCCISPVYSLVPSLDASCLESLAVVNLFALVAANLLADLLA